jgi:hypothetical protein
MITSPVHFIHGSFSYSADRQISIKMRGTVFQKVLRHHICRSGTDFFTAQDLFPDRSKSRSTASSKLARVQLAQTLNLRLLRCDKKR